jgi:hypothetical protein
VNDASAQLARLRIEHRIVVLRVVGLGAIGAGIGMLAGVAVLVAGFARRRQGSRRSWPRSPSSSW